MSALTLTISKLFSVAAIVEAVGVKIFPGAAPQNTDPQYLIVYKSSQDNLQLLSGNADMPKARMTVESYGNSASEADALGELVFESLKNVTNEQVLGPGSPGEVVGTITIVPTDSDVDDYDDTKQSYRRMIDFYVDWRRP